MSGNNKPFFPFNKGKEENQKVEEVKADQNLASQEKKEESGTITLSMEQLDALLEKKLAEKQQSQKTEVASKPIEQFIKIENTDDIPELESFEYKNRRYEVLSGSNPNSCGIRNRSKKGSPLQYIHPVTKQAFSLRLTSNQSSFFEEKQSKEKGSVALRYINIKDNVLFVPATDAALQKFLHIHPDKNKVFKEIDEIADAQKELDLADLRFKAESLIRNLELPKQDAVARMICNGYSDEWDSAIMRNNLFSEVRKHAKPKYIIELCENENLLLQGLAKTAKNRVYINYSNYRFTDENGVFLLEVSRNENEWIAFASYLASNEGAKTRMYLEDKIY
jgi:hypothetical protein